MRLFLDGPTPDERNFPSTDVDRGDQRSVLSADRLGLTTADVAEEAWDERSLLEEEARYEARRSD